MKRKVQTKLDFAVVRSRRVKQSPVIDSVDSIDKSIDDGQKKRQKDGVEIAQINGETLLELSDDVLDKLKAFDLTYKYGPCLGLTRLQRWNRAKKLKLNPPVELEAILLSKACQESQLYQECLWYNQV